MSKEELANNYADQFTDKRNEYWWMRKTDFLAGYKAANSRPLLNEIIPLLNKILNEDEPNAQAMTAYEIQEKIKDFLHKENINET